MRALFPGLALLSLLCAPVLGQSTPPLLALPQDGSTTLSPQEVIVTSQSVRIQVEARALREVLQYIYNVSGIHFSLSQMMMRVPVTMTINASDWPAAIRRLLRQFNIAEVWNQDGTHLHWVFILDSGEIQDLPPIGARLIPAEAAFPLETSRREPVDSGTREAPPGVSLSLPQIPPPPTQWVPSGPQPSVTTTQPVEAGPNASRTNRDGPPVGR